MHPPTPSLSLRQRIVGHDQLVPLLDGSLVTYVNLDNAASTPALRDAMDAVERFMPYYASVHRGTGFKSRLSTVAYDQAHEIVGHFVGADLRSNTVIFGKNTTEAINKLSFRLPAGSGPGDHHHPARAPLQRPALARPLPGGSCAGAA
jgi:cysteine desulfurase / selenocysteine lyase